MSSRHVSFPHLHFRIVTDLPLRESKSVLTHVGIAPHRLQTALAVFISTALHSNSISTLLSSKRSADSWSFKSLDSQCGEIITMSRLCREPLKASLPPVSPQDAHRFRPAPEAQKVKHDGFRLIIRGLCWIRIKQFFLEGRCCPTSLISNGGEQRAAQRREPNLRLPHLGSGWRGSGKLRRFALAGGRPLIPRNLLA